MRRFEILFSAFSVGMLKCIAVDAAPPDFAMIASADVAPDINKVVTAAKQPNYTTDLNFSMVFSLWVYDKPSALCSR